MGHKASLVDGQHFLAIINNRLVKTRLAYRESVWRIYRHLGVVRTVHHPTVCI